MYRLPSLFPKDKNTLWLYSCLPAAAWDTMRRRRSSKTSAFVAWVGIVELHHKAAETKRQCKRKELTCDYKALICMGLAISF